MAALSCACSNPEAMKAGERKRAAGYGFKVAAALLQLACRHQGLGVLHHARDVLDAPHLAQELLQ